MPTVNDVFAPLIGQMVWRVNRGHGSFLTMEFGKPHIEVRDPRPPKADDDKASPQFKENAKRRRIFLSGQWGLWIMDAHWNISAFGKSCMENDTPQKVDDVLKLLDGQKLMRVDVNTQTHASTFQWDLGAVMQLTVPAEAIMEKLWDLVDCDKGTRATCLNNGTLELEETQSYVPGSINFW